MSDRFPSGSGIDPTAADALADAMSADAALTAGCEVGGFRIDRVISRAPGSVVYAATDQALALPVALEEYLPARFVRRDATRQLVVAEPWHEAVVARGLNAFIDETRWLARCDHPALLRVKRLFEANGSAYRVLPLCNGQRLSDLRHNLLGAPDEAALRRFLDGLLGAIECVHRTGRVHGGVSPENILLLDEDRPLLLAPGSADRAIGSDLVDSLMATLQTSALATDGSASNGTDPCTPPTGPARDLCALAETLRFCITAEPLSGSDESGGSGSAPLRQREPLASAIAREFPPARRPDYSAALLQTLDAALSPVAHERPLSVAQFRQWLDHGVPAAEARRGAAPHASAAAMSSALLSPGWARSAGADPIAAPAASSLSSSRLASTSAVGADTITAPGAIEPVRAATPPTAPAPGAAMFGRIEPRMPETALGGDDPAAAAPAAREPMGAGAAARHAAPPPAFRRNASAPRRHYYKALLVAGLGTLALGVLGLITGAWQGMPALALDPPFVASLAASAPTPPTADRSTLGGNAGDLTGLPTAPLEPPSPSPLPLPAMSGNTATPRAACIGRSEFALYRCMQEQCKAAAWSLHPQCVKLRQTDAVD